MKKNVIVTLHTKDGNKEVVLCKFSLYIEPFVVKGVTYKLLIKVKNEARKLLHCEPTVLLLNLIINYQ